MWNNKLLSLQKKRIEVFISQTADILTSHLLVIRIYSSFHLTSQLFAQKRGRPRCHGNSISARKDRLREERTKGDEGAEGVSIPAVEFSTRRRSRWEKNFSRSSRTPSLHTLSHLLGGLDFLCFPVSFFSFLPFLSFLTFFF